MIKSIFRSREVKKKQKNKDLVCKDCLNKSRDFIIWTEGKIEYYSCSCPTGLKILSKMDIIENNNNYFNTISIKPLKDDPNKTVSKENPFGSNHDNFKLYCECIDCSNWRKEKGFEIQQVDLTQ